MNEIIRAIRRLLRMEKDIAQIVSPVGKILRELEAYATAQDAAARNAKVKAAKLHSEAEMAEASVVAATALKAKYAELTV